MLKAECSWMNQPHKHGCDLIIQTYCNMDSTVLKPTFTSCLCIGTTCACSWGMTFCLVVCPVLLSPMPFWAPILSRLSWETMSLRNTALTTSVTSALHPTRHMSWRREWWSCTGTIGQRKYDLLRKCIVVKMQNVRFFFRSLWKIRWGMYGICLIEEWVQQRRIWTF